MKRLVMDTNTIISAIGWDGPPHWILRACLRGELAIFISPDLFEELTAVLARPKLAVVASHPDLPEILAWLCQPARLVIPHRQVKVIEADAEDNRVLECAVAAQADAVVSGDQHLLDLGFFEGIRIMGAREACNMWQILP